MEDRPVALVAYDLPYPEPLHSVRAIAATFGLSLLLAPEAGARAVAAIDIELVPEKAAATCMMDPALEILRLGTPPARGLPLLAALAKGVAASMTIDYLSTAHLRVTLNPC